MNKTQIEQRLSNELKSFDGLWDGGYFEGEGTICLSMSVFCASLPHIVTEKEVGS